MIATRFRSVYWVGGVAVAALGCYLVSQRVAAERAHLAKVETAIVFGERQIRSLETEIGTRAGLKQIERWNVDVLALSAPKAAQFVTSDAQLAGVVQSARPAAPAVVQVAVAESDTVAEGVPHVTRASYEAPVIVAARIVAPKLKSDRAPATNKAKDMKAKEAKASKIKASEAKAKDARTKPQDATRLAKQEAHAKRTQPAERKRAEARDRDADDAPRVRSTEFVTSSRKPSAVQKVALLDNKLLGDLGRLARDERTGSKRNR